MERPAESTRTKLDGVVIQADVCAPDHVIPFASFVWSCHEENYFMTRDMNRIHDVDAFLRQHCESNPLVLYPGDTFEVGDDDYDCTAAIEKSRAQYDSLESRPAQRSTAVLPEALTEAGKNFLGRRNDNASWLAIRLYLAREAHCHRDKSKGGKRSSRLQLVLSRLFPRTEPTSLAGSFWRHDCRGLCRPRSRDRLRGPHSPRQSESCLSI